MSLHAVLALAAAGLALAVAGYVLVRDIRSLVHRMFALGLLTLAAEQGLLGLSALSSEPAEVLRWQWLGLAAIAFVPGTWLLFSLTFARANPRQFVGWSRPVVVASFAAPLLILAAGRSSLFTGAGAVEPPRLLLRVGWAGYALHLVLLLSAVLVLMNLERTLKAAVGAMRWGIKFMALGVGGFFAIRIYTSSQVLLFQAVDTRLQVLDAGALLVALVFVAFSLTRAHLLAADIYLSQAVLYNSLTILIVGVYLLAVGVLAKAVAYLGETQALPLATLVVFLSLMALAVVLLSDQFRGKVRQFVERNFRRPRHDYRKQWMAFTRGTSGVVDVHAYCAAVARAVAETFGTSSVTLWLLDADGQRVVPGGSTEFSQAQARQLVADGGEAGYVARVVGERLEPIALPGGGNPDPGPTPAYMGSVRCAVAVIAGSERLGFLTLNQRVTKEPFTAEDFDLLKTIADQAAAGLLNRRLSQQLLKARETEAFQALSAFFVHDLKNLASKLSLTLQNLPQHYDDPAFRDDMLAVISRSVEKINRMCTRLSPLSRRLEIAPVEADLNEVVSVTVASLKPGLRAELAVELTPLPPLFVDREQVQKVVTNLVLNASEALGEGGAIRVVTARRDAWAVVSVTDNGCGMSREYVAESLFQPFRTTKEQGLGIGLFHSKTIVEAHQGRIEVESEEGVGSTFRVLLPIPDAAAAAGPRSSVTVGASA